MTIHLFVLLPLRYTHWKRIF